MTWFGLSEIHKENLITREDQIFSESTKKRRRKQTVTNGDMNKLARLALQCNFEQIKRMNFNLIFFTSS